MPELPDLIVIQNRLGPALSGKVVAGARVHEPIVLRILEEGDFATLLAGQRVEGLDRHGPFLRLGLERHDLVMHLMLAGRLRLAPIAEKRLAWEAFAIDFEDGQTLSYGDEKNMGKVYLCRKGDFSAIPGYGGQGLDIVSPAFTWERFSKLIENKRNQARAFIMDQTKLSAIGNAYADEILFEAGIHPKTPCCYLTSSDRRKLYEAISTIIDWGTGEVEKAARPTEEKVRAHMRVRNRGGEACPRCGTTIRKAGVLGFDAYFCPKCQPDRSGRGLDWNKLPDRPPSGGRAGSRDDGQTR
ncbi:MAG TPA: DNA-formamidopyrimidine glycosylase family protein [Rectinemataceae bacterium]|nr:DNA-formamidopyrimidine glycosylase family protein [Rectinemataceae bacterium]